MERNELLSAKLRLIANLLEYQGVQFKPAAYRRAAQTIEELKQDISALGTEAKFKQLPGIGDAIAKKITEFLKTGEIPLLASLQSELGPSVSDLMSVEDLGPRRVAEIQQALGIRTVEELIAAAEQGKLRNLPRFSELLEKKILANAQRATIRSKRYAIDEVRADADKLLSKVRGISGVVRAEAAGSYRRNKESIGDLDILVAVRSRAEKIPPVVISKIEEAVKKLPMVAKVVAQGPTKMSFDLASGLRVDIRFVKDREWGSALLYFTGDKEHNIALRRLAIERGWKLNEYGLYKGSKVIAQRTEEDIYKALGLPYIEPEKRMGELQ